MKDPNVVAVLGLLLGLGVKHLIVDFALQPPYMYLNKGKFGHPGGIIHSLLHAASTIVVIGIWSVVTKYGIAGAHALVNIVVLEFWWHYMTDLTKVRLCQHFGWRALPPKGKEHDVQELAKCNCFWIALGVDQFSHFTNYLVIAFVMMAI
jgi:hypothetical protein